MTRSNPEDRARARIRDVPRSCSCVWVLRYNPLRYRLLESRWECSWHGEASDE